MNPFSSPGWFGFGLTDVGRVRKQNQDAFAVRNDLQLWVLADGMGGHAGGDIASRMAVQSVTDYLESYGLALSKGEEGGTQYEGLLVNALENANQAIREEARGNKAVRGMGTTVVAVLIMPGNSGDQAVVAHAGDSRLYLLRKDKLILWTRDHTLMEERLALNLITAEQVRTHPQRHVLTKALGIEPLVMPTVRTYGLEIHDRLLLCSDGLTKMLTDEEIESLVVKRSTVSQQTCQDLIETANRLGGEDNTTVIIVGKENVQRPSR